MKERFERLLHAMSSQWAFAVIPYEPDSFQRLFKVVSFHNRMQCAGVLRSTLCQKYRQFV